MISMMRSIFPVSIGVNALKLAREKLILRVQLMSLEWVGFGVQLKAACENRRLNQQRNANAIMQINLKSLAQVHADDQSALPPWWLAWLAQVTTMGLHPC